MRVIQMLPSLSYGDAVGNDVMALDNALRGAGYETGIYAENIGARVPQGRAHRISKLPRLKDDDVIIYHLSVGTELNFRLPAFHGRKMIIYHNVTPYEFFSGYSHNLWQLCKYGLEGVEFLADKAEYCLADSEFNKQNLIDLGYKCPIDVLPILIPFDDYKQEPNQGVIERYSGDGYTNLLFTGRVAPNKCHEDIIAAFYQYQKNYNDKSRLFLVGNFDEREIYYNKLASFAEKLGLKDKVIFTGHIGFDEILAYYHIADAFICMSEHEGFCVPLVEAMFFDIPIIAYDSSAISYTLGGSGILIKEKNPLEVAGVIDYLQKHADVKEALLQGQRERLKDFDNEVIEKQFLKYLSDYIEGTK